MAVAPSSKSVKTGKSCGKQFIYRLSAFDGQGGIRRWEIGADLLSAWMLSGVGNSRWFRVVEFQFMLYGLFRYRLRYVCGMMA